MSSLERLLGRWATESTHPMLPGVVVHGSVTMEWLPGERFLVHRLHMEHPEFPDSLSIIGEMSTDRMDGSTGPGGAELSMHYYDSRGVFRIYRVSLEDRIWRIWRDAPGFSQRFAGTFAEDGRSVQGVWQLCRDDQTWVDDLRITYRQ